MHGHAQLNYAANVRTANVSTTRRGSYALSETCGTSVIIENITQAFLGSAAKAALGILKES